METLLHWDTALFHWINSGWSNAILDVVMPAARNKYTWLPLYVFCISWMGFNLPVRHTLMTLLFIVISIFASDTISSKLIKNNVHRLRPCHEQAMNPPVIERVTCGSGYSFTSSHAANHFCLASFMVIVFGTSMGRWKHLWWFWAMLVSLAQVYVGLHYPLDVIGGGILGIIIGTSMGIFCKHKLK